MANCPLSRREALGVISGTILAATVHAAKPRQRFLTRGVVLYPWDLSLTDWPERAKHAGLTTIGLHAGRRLDILVDFVKSEPGRTFLAACRRLGIDVEYELHAFGSLLSREWFASPKADLFRMDATGQRNPDSNCCPSAPEAHEIIAEKAVEYGRLLKPTTGRYFFWPDDTRDWCCCPKCKEFSPSDQALLVENSIAAALRAHLDPKATLSHICYNVTLPPPRIVKPHEGLFLEFAPIARVYDHAIDDPSVQLSSAGPEPKSHTGYLDLLEANLALFPRDTAQVLEYWLDVSRFSNWKRPAVKLPWSDTVIRADANAYAKLGIRHATSFATWIDADYITCFGEPPLAEYASALNQ